MPAKTYVSFFTDKTEAEARVRWAAGNFLCGHRCRTAVQPNDLVLMVNHQSGYVVAVGRAASGCMDHAITDAAYTAEDAKYNKYAILVKDLTILKRRVSQRDLRTALGVDDEDSEEISRSKTTGTAGREDKSRTNIYKGFPNSWQQAFIQSEDAPRVLSRLNGWIEGVLAA